MLGIGGDNSDFGVGTFYVRRPLLFSLLWPLCQLVNTTRKPRVVPLQEGALTASYTSDATDDAVQANIVAAGYGR